MCLVKPVTTSLPVYTMQTHYFPKSVCTRIDSITRNFFWGRGDQQRGWNLVSWQVVTTPRNLGGLGVRDTRLSNLALLGKLVWSKLHERDKLWVQVLTHKYVRQSLWASTNSGTPSITWRSIVQAIENLNGGFKMRLNSGNTSL